MLKLRAYFTALFNAVKETVIKICSTSQKTRNAVAKPYAELAADWRIHMSNLSARNTFFTEAFASLDDEVSVIQRLYVVKVVINLDRVSRNPLIHS